MVGTRINSISLYHAKISSTRVLLVSTDSQALTCATPEAISWSADSADVG